MGGDVPLVRKQIWTFGRQGTLGHLDDPTGSLYDEGVLLKEVHSALLNLRNHGGILDDAVLFDSYFVTHAEAIDDYVVLWNLGRLSLVAIAR